MINCLSETMRKETVDWLSVAQSSFTHTKKENSLFPYDQLIIFIFVKHYHTCDYHEITPGNWHGLH